MMDAKDSKLKISGAEHHLKVLNQRIEPLIDSGAYTFNIEPDPQPPEYVVTALRKRAIPEDLSLIIGDFAHNCRSCLDMLIYSISTLSPTDSDRRRLQFPICDTKGAFNDECRSGRLKGVGAPELADIKSFQPYHRGYPLVDELALIREINNTDKHRVIQIITVVDRVDSMGFKGPGNLGTAANIILGPGATLNVGGRVRVPGLELETFKGITITDKRTVVAKFKADPQTKMNMQPNVIPEIQFTIGDIRSQQRPVLSTLTSILDRVKEVVRKFDPSVV